MIKEELKINLFEDYLIMREMPGWLRYFREADYSQGELDYLESLDDEFSSYNPEKEANDWAGKVMDQGGPYIYFEEDSDKKLSLISGKIGGIYKEYEEKFMRDEPYSSRFISLNLSGVDRLEKLRRGVRGKQLHVEEKLKFGTSSGVDDIEIERARSYPLEQLVPDINKHGRVLCPFHPDKNPSALVRNGYFYCFTCGESSDSIKWLMTQHNFTFVQAVKKLSEGEYRAG